MENRLVVARQGLGGRKGRREIIAVIRGQHEGSLGWWKYSVEWLYQCQYSCLWYMTVYKMLPQWENWVKGTWYLSVLSLTSSCGSTIIWKGKSQIFKKISYSNFHIDKHLLCPKPQIFNVIKYYKKQLLV